MSSATLPLYTPVRLIGAMPPPASGATVKLNVRPWSRPVGSLQEDGDLGISTQPSPREPDAQVDIAERSPVSNAAAAAEVTSRHYVTTLGRIEELLQEDDAEDRPSDYARESAVEFLQQVARELGLHFPRASVSVGPARGLRITWSCGGREIRLICGPSPASKTYIYHESPTAHAVDCRVSGPALARYLRWACQEA